MRIADVSIRRPVFAVMLVGSLVVLGVVSIERLGVDLFPRVEFPMTWIRQKLCYIPQWQKICFPKAFA